jgi:hypothetical protein
VPGAVERVRAGPVANLGHELVVEALLGGRERIARRLADPGRHSPELCRPQILGAAGCDECQAFEAVEDDLWRTVRPCGVLEDPLEARFGLVQPPELGQREAVVRSREPTRIAGRRLEDLAQAPLGRLEVTGDDVGVPSIDQDRVQRVRVA